MGCRDQIIDPGPVAQAGNLLRGSTHHLDMKRDPWASWLLERRSGGDPEAAERIRTDLHPIRDRVLDAARLGSGGRLLDVGCGDGLIAFGALERGVAEVIFSDVSQDLLDTCRQLATEAGVLRRCRFVRASAEDLGELADGCVSAITTRSVLIFVQDKARALREFWRVLAPGGRISLFEPINGYFRGPDGRLPPPVYELGPVEDLAERVGAIARQAHPAGASPMLDFDERDLLTAAERAGFTEVHVRLEIDVQRARPRRWEFAYRSAPNPLAPTLEEALHQALTPAERERYVAHLRPLVESGAGTIRLALAYLSAIKPT
jgi:SAM-dependent methyltransferase